MFISTAYAQSGGSGGSDIFIQLLPLVLIFVVFWFFLIRPQQKRAKEHREMVAAVKRNDQVVTAGGVMGKVTKVVDNDTVQVEICEGVRVRVVKSTLTNVTGKGQPAKAGGAKETPKADAAVDDGDDGDKAEAAAGGKKPLFSFGGKK